MREDACVLVNLYWQSMAAAWHWQTLSNFRPNVLIRRRLNRTINSSCLAKELTGTTNRIAAFSAVMLSWLQHTAGSREDRHEKQRENGRIGSLSQMTHMDACVNAEF